MVAKVLMTSNAMATTMCPDEHPHNPNPECPDEHPYNLNSECPVGKSFMLFVRILDSHHFHFLASIVFNCVQFLISAISQHPPIDYCTVHSSQKSDRHFPPSTRPVRTASQRIRTASVLITIAYTRPVGTTGRRLGSASVLIAIAA